MSGGARGRVTRTGRVLEDTFFKQAKASDGRGVPARLRGHPPRHTHRAPVVCVGWERGTGTQGGRARGAPATATAPPLARPLPRTPRRARGTWRAARTSCWRSRTSTSSSPRAGRCWTWGEQQAAARARAAPPPPSTPHPLSPTTPAQVPPRRVAAGGLPGAGACQAGGAGAGGGPAGDAAARAVLRRAGQGVPRRRACAGRRVLGAVCARGV